MKIRTEEQEKIVQILPADGWYVEFCFDGLSVTRVRLVCWALVRRTGDGEELTEIIGAHARDGFVFLVFEAGAEFTGYIHESQFNA